MPLYKEGQFVDNTTAIPQGHSSNGRTAVSKTDGCEFESYCPCQNHPKHSTKDNLNNAQKCSILLKIVQNFLCNFKELFSKYRVKLN